MNTHVPVVILNGCEHGNLGIVRSLGKLGIAVNLIHRSRLPAVSCSRWLQRSYLWNIESSSAEATLSFLNNIARQLGTRALLIASDDHSAVFVAEHAVILRDWFIFPEMRAGLVRDLASKKGMYELATRHGIPTARSLFPQSLDEALSFVESSVFPVLLKGIDGQRLRKRTGVPMVIVRDQRELLQCYRSMEDVVSPNIMIQEYIPGGSDSVWMFNGYFDQRSECLIAFTGQKLRQYPIDTGPTSLGICAKNQTVETTIKRFMTAVGYKGMLDVGTRYDPRYGTYKVLDVNPRIGSTFRLFVDNLGMDVARACYMDMTGQAIQTGSFPEGRKWIVEDYDLVASLRQRSRGSLSLTDWARSLRGVREGGYFSWQDPMPLIGRVFSLACITLKRLFRKAKSLIRVGERPQPVLSRKSLE